ncbi:DNA replication complex subunit Gins51 [Halalkalicoccus jeotgali]|uniref:Gins51 C-terminal domain-containing protein n=1 Tax=Halalkalicoccus jeotgali (strain DSM 18796 / CECT 7217 / JCM 14584 / KCTC 4019 / B3) TaxID=795797 RepID=D8J2A1_HALJB|nr:hypothetical protein [Halalkalicoccus jeotgali]ADJ14858.1 hypothetical protein HacjB3_07365 [Halalkalicoccus jeotgali B3]ELY39440.1 hypothetical protein C497_05772 [Halalkalicoccus jeotgali B3]
MDLGELQSVKDTERGKDSLQHLPDSFYTDVADHIASLKDERSARANEADDPFGDPEVQRLTGEIDSTEQVVTSIYERRVGKLVKLASFAAADMPADEEGLTSEERELFSDLVARIKENRGHVLDVLAGETDPDPVEPADGSPESTPDSPDQPDPTEEPSEPTDMGSEPDSTVTAADLMGDGSEPESVPASAGAMTDEPDTDDVAGPAGPSDLPEPSEPDRADDDDGRVERTTLRITRDVGEIVGVDDREYELATDDIVTLPEVNAGALLEREAAERLD